MEKLSFIGAAQRLGVTVAEVQQMIKGKELKEVSKGKVSKEQIYNMSGLNPEGNQTKKSAGRKPNRITYEEAKEILKIDDEGLHGLIKSGELEKYELDNGTFGVSERTVKMRKKKVDDREEPVEKPKMRTAMAGPIPVAKEVGNVKEETEEKSASEEVKTDTDDTPTSSSSRSTEEMEAKSSNDTEDVEMDKRQQEKEAEKQNKEDTQKKYEDREHIGMIKKDVFDMLLPCLLMIDAGTSKAMLKKGECEKPKYSKSERREATDLSYKLGCLSVYESMSEFKRKETA